ncbi:hypothetical protein FPOAC2_06896 [Fusarium poae]|uniref:Uncharacterized protein n=1 Tax=Fusarium poae TaxID=36050 RepID=A0A1B8AYS5_FUSPO|nr:hypothetical protein FPOAC1_006764 [Fusarium poae]KAG8673452.1 hypothetical protein FPOAC1_006764 [Fusarium poae]OBS25648.1 hypothetical protein FPOA_06182 [Fusarium poae]
MQQDESTRGHYSDPLTSRLTPLRPDFLENAPGFESRARSLSPSKRLVKQPLHIRMNLTESQVDKITDAFSQNVYNSPKKSTKSRKKPVMATPRSTPRKKKQRSPQTRDSHKWLAGDGSFVADSPTFSELMPGRRSDSSRDMFSASIAERRQRNAPSPLQLETTHRSGALSRSFEIEDNPGEVSPLGEGRFERGPIFEDDSPSVYSTQPTARPSPLHLSHVRSHSKVNGNGNDSYKEWLMSHDPSMVRESETRTTTLVNRPRRSKSSADGLRMAQAMELHSPTAQVVTVHANNHGNQVSQNTPLFSPLQFYFRGADYPSTKKGEKEMIGDNGWLERTDRGVVEHVNKTPQKKTRILDSIKKMARDVAEIHTSRRAQPILRPRAPSHIAISLNAREQSLLYCELEFNLSTALNDYIVVQLDKGRLVPDKLKKVADAWHSKGRPKVVGFRYDLETQLELINLHIDDFRFYGRRQADPTEIGGLLHAMKVNARAIGVRTLCQPDSVIAKQLVDAQSIFKMLGVLDEQQVALAEIAQFFKVIVERELDKREGNGGHGKHSREERQ